MASSAVFQSFVLLTGRGTPLPFATTRPSGIKNVFHARTGPPTGPMQAKTPLKCPYRSRSWTGTSSGWVCRAEWASNGREEAERYKICRMDLPSVLYFVSNDYQTFLLENRDPGQSCFLFPQRFSAELYRRIFQFQWFFRQKLGFHDNPDV